MDLPRFLADLRSRLWRVLILDGLARIVVALVVMVAVVIVLDYGFHLPGALRLGALACVIGTMGWMAWRRLQRPLSRPMDDATLARFVERRAPALGGRLVSGIEGIPLSERDHATLAAELAPGATQRLVPARELPRRLGTAIGALGVALLIVLAAPSLVVPGLQRLFVPWGDIEWARSSSLVIDVDRAVVPEDEPIVVSVSRPQGGEASVRLTWVERTQRSRETRLVDGSVGAIARRQPLTLAPGRYRITAESGDALPVAIDVQVVSRPVLDRIHATLTAPAYVGMAEQDLNTLACTALPGSKLVFEVGFTMESGRTVDRYVLMFGDQSVPITATATGFRGEMDITTGGEFLAVIADQDGIGPRPEPRFALTVMEDRAPSVRLGGARNNEAVSPRAILDVSVDANDDHGLADLRLRLTTVEGGVTPPADSERDLEVFSGISGEATTRTHHLEVGSIAGAGQRLILVGVATDRNNVSGPGVGRSEPLVLRVVSEEDLRHDLDRQVVEALERVRQSREDLGKGLSEQEALGTASRNALMAARKAGDLLRELRRRAKDNRLDNDLAGPVGEASDAVNDRASPQLAEAASAGANAEAAARTADAALAEAEQRLQSLRQEGDLSRLLAHLIQLQRNLNEETRALVRTYLVKAIDEAGRTRFQDLSGRQKAVSAQVREVERRLLAATGEELQAAQELVRRDHPADRLDAATVTLTDPAARAKAGPHQEAALTSMEQLLELLRGNDADRALAERIGALADRQEQLAKELERGVDPRSLTERQKDLEKETAELAEVVENQGKDPDATAAMKGAQRDQNSASKGMQSGESKGAARDAAAAAAELREAQRKLQGGEEKDDKKQDDPDHVDVLKILKELRGMQVKILNGSQVIAERLGEQDLDFAAKRDLEPLAEMEVEIVLRLRGEVLPALEQMVIAKQAIERVAAAVEQVIDHIGKPALGERGLILEKIALHELSRLLDVVEAMPQGKPGEEGGQGSGPGGGQQAPFPPAAELALLAAMQEEIARATVTGRSGVEVDQKMVADLVEMLRQSARPGSRPAVLLDRAGRATASAEYRLRQGDRGLTTRHEQEAAHVALLRILQEAEASSGGGSGSSSSSSQQQRREPGSPKPGEQPGEQQPGDPSTGGSTGGGAAGSTEAGTDGAPSVVVREMPEASDMHLPPERREQLRQAFQHHLPPQALPLYRRYLELLEDER